MTFSVRPGCLCGTTVILDWTILRWRELSFAMKDLQPPPLSLSSTSTLGCVNQKCLQTLPRVPRGAKLLLVENNGLDRPGFNSSFCHLLAVRPWANDLISLSILWVNWNRNMTSMWSAVPRWAVSEVTDVQPLAWLLAQGKCSINVSYTSCFYYLDTAFWWREMPIMLLSVTAAHQMLKNVVRNKNLLRCVDLPWQNIPYTGMYWHEYWRDYRQIQHLRIHFYAIMKEISPIWSQMMLISIRARRTIS